jgi:putative nucleotidyltransferase with HDIG domain
MSARFPPLERFPLLRNRQTLRVAGYVLAAVVFALVTTAVVALDSILPGRNAIATLAVGAIAPEDIRAPVSMTYVSSVLTEQRRQAATESVTAIYAPPDPNVARQQIQLLQQIVDYVDNVRHDPYGTLDQKLRDLSAITALTLNDTVTQSILQMDEETWRSVSAEMVNVLERVMRESIRETDLPVVLDTLPTQVSVRFNSQSAALVTAVVEDLVRPNRFPDPEATENARREAANQTPTESRSFERGQVVVRAGAPINDADYEALQQLGLLETPDRRLTLLLRAFIASVTVLVTIGLYAVRCRPQLFDDKRMLSLLAGLFLIVLLGARLFSGSGQVYLVPVAALALLYVVLTETDIAVVSTMGLALLVGVMLNDSLEAAVLTGVGGAIGALTLRRSERLNSYFFAGIMIALANTMVVAIFNATIADQETNVGLRMVYGLINGGLAAATALVGMYFITILFNLPTSLKLVELSQPGQPLLQRLLREAPGTYQHSLQVANLSEQAANAVDANAELVRVASLYHDVGKILNPAFFVENQADGVNPHEGLNDPYRSADIIISHVTDGERMARQYRLPARIRDFILEHHGTTMVAYFYHQAASQTDDQDAVDIEQFMYPGPKPQSRETAILMLADSCESSVRARKPSNRQEIAEIVDQIFENRMRDGQLDESNMTLKDIETARTIFIEMLQAVYHPRINYPVAPAPRTRTQEIAAEVATEVKADVLRSRISAANEIEAAPVPEGAPAARTQTLEIPAAARDAHRDDDDSPLPEVPPLRRTKSNGSEPSVETDRDVHD